MINNNLYGVSTPIYDFDTDDSYSGYIPDQNQPQYYQPDNSRDLYMQQQMQQDMERQFQQYMQQKQVKQQAQQYYNIQRGDTLGQIAAAHGMSVQDLARLNGINNINLIRAGQRLRFNDDLNNVYRDVVPARRARTVRRSTASNNVISSNPKRVQQQVKEVRKNNERTYNDKQLPEVVVTYKRPVIHKKVDLNNPYYQNDDEITAYRKYKNNKSKGRISSKLSYAQFLRKFNYPLIDENDYVEYYRKSHKNLSKQDTRNRALFKLRELPNGFGE